MTASSYDELRCGSIAHPQQNDRFVPFFSHWEKAIEHLIAHVLTAPECQGWAIVIPQVSTQIDLQDVEARTRAAQQARESRGVRVQALFDLYRSAADAASREAGRLGWVASRNACTVALGTTGVLVLIDHNRVVTCYLPGLSGPTAINRARNDCRSVLSREQCHRMRGGLPSREQRRQQRREQRWSAEESLYYRVFRPAVQFIRGRFHEQIGLDGRIRYDAALLKDCLPPMSQLKLENWRAYRVPTPAGGLP